MQFLPAFHRAHLLSQGSVLAMNDADPPLSGKAPAALQACLFPRFMPASGRGNDFLSRFAREIVFARNLNFDFLREKSVPRQPPGNIGDLLFFLLRGG